MNSFISNIEGFCGMISREITNSLLNSCPKGTFLIRESSHFPGDYTLSINGINAIEHYRIQMQNNKKGMTIDEEEYFDDFQQLVEHYKKDADGLCCQLVKPVTDYKNIQELISKQIITSKSDKKIVLNSISPSNSQFEKSINGVHIKRTDLSFIEQIGKGEFSEVHKASYKGQDVAVKIVKDKSLLSAFESEVSIMQSINHPNLVHLIAIVDEKDSCLWIVTEFMPKGSLVEYLRTRGRSVINNNDQLKFVRDISSGMAYLEGKGLVHRDLAARNVLLNENCHAKVSDFGLAIHGNTSTSGTKIPVKWTAPEALKHGKFTSKSDVWSFGILLWEIYTFGRVPYPRISLNDVPQWIEEGNKMDQPEGCPDDIYKIMLSSWNYEPNSRPSFKSISSDLNFFFSTSSSTDFLDC